MKALHCRALFALVMVCGCGELEEKSTDAVQQKSSSGTSADGPAFGYDYVNNPLRVDTGIEMKFDALPRQGKTAETPWTDSYWPKYKGGIAYRWQTQESHTYETIPYEQVLQMSEDQVALLSPTEKYDLYVGNREYSLTRRVNDENRPSTPQWQGYCHGWAMASMHFDEPQPVVMVNPDGLRIPFGSSDVKALLTYLQGEIVSTEHYGNEQVPFRQGVTVLGSVCTSNKATDPACQDTNAGAFHIVMANSLGLKGEAFGIDATTTSEKWNQPVHSYETTVVERRRARPDAASDVVEEVIVQTKIIYTMEIDPTWDATNWTQLHKDHEKTFTYRLDLDSAGRIVNGDWVLLAEGGPYTMAELYQYFEQLDENGDGQPDLTKDRVEAAVWQYFDFPDYVWLQGKAEFSETFTQAYSAYALAFATLSSRKATYEYLAKLEDIYDASRAQR